MTTLLGAMLTDKKISEWKKKVGEEKAAKISAEATTRGKNYHSLMESYLQNTLNEEELDPFQIELLMNARKRVDNIDNVMCIEKALFSEKYRIAGTVDCIAEYNGVLSVIDHKTSSKFKKEEWIQNYFLQETGYALMFEELTGIKIDQVVTIISIKDSHYPPQVFIKKASDYKDQLINLVEEFYVNNVHNKRSE
jgi:genome maintenance exonuclease 1